MDTTNSQKKSPRDSMKKSEKQSNATEPPEIQHEQPDPHDHERSEERTFDLVARVRAAKEAAQRRMEEFGDVSEYTVTKIYGRKKEPPLPGTQSSLDFHAGNSEQQQTDAGKE